MSTLLNWGKENTGIQAACFILLALSLITPVCFSNNIAFGVTEAKFFFLYFTSLASIPILLILLTRKTIYVTFADLAVAVLLVYLILFNFNFHQYNKKLYYFLSGGIIYFLIKLAAQDDKRRSKLLVLIIVNIIYLIAIYCCAFAHLQQLGWLKSFNYSFKITSTFFHPAPFACFIAAILPGSFYMAVKLYRLNHLSMIYKILFINSLLATLSILITLPLTNSRSAFIASATAILLNSKKLKKLTGIALNTKFKSLIVIGLVCSLTTFTYLLINLRKDSVTGRLLVWKITSGIITRKPVTGSGLDSFRYLYPHYQIDYFRNHNHSIYEEKLSYEVTSAFNEILQIGSETGVLGVVMIIIITYSIFKTSSKGKQNILISSSLSSLIALTIFSLFSYSFSMVELVLYYFVFIAIVNSQSENLKKYYRRDLLLKIILVPVLLSHVYVVFQVYNSIRLYYKWNICGLLYEDKQIKESSAQLESMLPALKNNDRYLSFYLRTLYDLKNYKKAIKLEPYLLMQKYEDLMLIAECYERTNLVSMAEEKYWKAYYLLPHKFSPLYCLMNLYLRNNYHEKAKSCARMILDKEVKVNSAEVTRIKSKALRLFKTRNIQPIILPLSDELP